MHTITMAAPAKNALDTELLTFLLDELKAAGGRPVFLAGTGDAFSSGLHLGKVAQLEGAAMLGFLLLLERVYTELYLYPAPTVAAVNGHAIAGGCVLALCCDRRIAARSAKTRIGLNEVPLGLRFPPRILAIVRDRVPRAHHEEVLLGGSLFDVEGAVRVGLVDEVAEDAAAAARDALTALAELPADAYAATKRALRGTASDLCDDETQLAALRAMLPVWTSPEIRARITKLLSR